jgi:peptide/nickel transport system permease protein
MNFKQMGIFSKASVIWLGLVMFFVVFGQFIPLPKPTDFDIDAMGVGLFDSWKHPLGTDSNGYDLLSNAILGSRPSMLISIVSVFVGGIIGSTLGIIAAYKRGKIDYIVNTVFNIVLSIPNLVLGLALVAVLATNPDPNIEVPTSRRVFVIVLSLTIVIVPILGRIARGATLSWSNREFVVAARSMGMKDSQIIIKHIVPNVLPAVYAVGFLAIGVVIVVEGSLSLLGVGIVDGVSWGSMIARVRGDLEFAPHSMLVPVTILALTVIACNQLGDVLRARLDSREGRL